LECWGRELRSLIRIHYYDILFTQSRIPSGTWIFSDLERLNSEETKKLQHYYMAAKSAGCPVYNEPQAFQDRFDILRGRAHANLSPKNVYRLEESLDQVEYPAFIRLTRDHSGPRSKLLKDRDELNDAISNLTRKYKSEDLLVVEWYDYRGENGLFTKYGAFRVGPNISPCHRISGTDWMLKSDKYLNDGIVKDERDYLSQNPHAEELLEIFKQANIDYGRVDYTLFKGRIQVFEINTNPSLSPVKPQDHLRHINQREKSRRLAVLIRDLSLNSPVTSNPIAVRGNAFKPISYVKRSLFKKYEESIITLRLRLQNNSNPGGAIPLDHPLFN
jgi:hypothetical protein